MILGVIFWFIIEDILNEGKQIEKLIISTNWLIRLIIIIFGIFVNILTLYRKFLVRTYV